MMNVEVVMKYLKIEKNMGFYSIDSTEWKSIDKLDKADLLSLVNLVLTRDFEMDKFDETLLRNPAHNIIYKHIYGKLNDLSNDKNRFKDESTNLYKKAIEKYSK